MFLSREYSSNSHDVYFIPESLYRKRPFMCTGFSNAPRPRFINVDQFVSAMSQLTRFESGTTVVIMGI
jgi:hypothetical protein